MPKIIELEGGKDWQATAENKNGNQIAIVRGDGGYYLYDCNWTPIAYVSSMKRLHTANEIKGMFASGELKLLKGSVLE